MDDKPLDLSKTYSSSNKESHHPTEKRQESIEDLRFTTNRSASYNKKEFSEPVKNSDSLPKNHRVNSRHNYLKCGDKIPRNTDLTQKNMHYAPEIKSGGKRYKYFDSVSNTKNKHKSTGLAEPNCYMKVSEKCISPRPSMSASESSNYGTEGIGKHIMKSKEKSTFDCEYCGKTWKCKSAYEVHVRSHTGVKPYGCQHCGKRFTQKSYLKVHALQHTGERPFPCNECLKTFQTRCNLKAHLRTHTGENPYTCDICGKTFQWQTQLTRHKEIHTKKAEEASF